MHSEEDILAARQYIRARARYLCGGLAGRGKLDPVYVETTQGRDPKKRWVRWSSCGELSQEMVWHMGCRLPFVNRSESPGGWRDGRNLLDFYDVKHVPSAPARAPSAEYEPRAGDIGFVWLTGRDAHTFIFGDRIDEQHFETFNYGAGGMSAVEHPGAKQSKSLVSRHNGKLYVGTRILWEVLTVPRLLEICEPALLPPMSGDVIDGLEALTP